MPNHVKPTQEELEQKTQEAIQEAEKLEKEGKTEEVTDDVVEEVEETTEETSDEELEEKEEVEETKEVEEEEEVKLPKENPIEKRYIESTREAQVLSAKNKKMNEAFEQASSISDVSEAELKAEYPDWDLMSDFEQKLAKKNLVNDKRFEAIQKVTKEFKDVDAWLGKVGEFVEDPKSLISYPALEGKTEEFKLFASKPTRRGVDFEDLVSAFLYSEKSKVVKNKGKMFESGTGGAKDKGNTKPGMVSVDDAAKLKKTNYNKYKELLKAGKISDEI